MHMKFSRLYLFAGLAAFSLASCNPSSLTDLNKDPNSLDDMVPEYVFTGAELAMPEYNYSVLSEGMQYFSTYKEVPAVGDKYFSFNGTIADFDDYYTNKLNRLMQLSDALQDPDDVNKLSMVRILRVYEFDQLTDVAGDIPYFDAMEGKDNLKPKYDTQKDIYLDMFKELDEAAAAFDASKPSFGAGDLFYNGDVTKWKKFAYTLMLRLGMRLTEVAPDLAKTWVQKAIAGGVMMEDDDIASIKYADQSGSQNPQMRNWLDGNFLSPGGDNVEGGKYAATFLDHLKDTHDPRLPVISVVWVPTTSGGATTYVADTSYDIQRGMVTASLNTKPNDFDTYSEPSPLVLNLAAPIIILSPAESYLLLAEAAARGWYSGMSAQQAYEKGVRAGMAQWSLYDDVAPSTGKIPEDKVDTYINNNPYPAGASFEKQLETISVQKWVCLFENDYEVYANWRRTGYPKLAPVNYPGNVTGGQMFRRFSLPNAEDLTNHDNYEEALTRQGFGELDSDNLLTRVWWDTKK
jgi:hypothetical protein